MWITNRAKIAPAFVGRKYSYESGAIAILQAPQVSKNLSAAKVGSTGFHTFFDPTRPDDATDAILKSVQYQTPLRDVKLQQELLDLPPADTPLMRQYRKIKEQNPNALLLFRMGDFYETFEDDALTASKVLGITLTKRANGQAKDVPLAGFPHHALDTYLPRLIEAGHRVAICEQLEDPKKAKKIVKRGVVEVVTPGVSFRDQLLEPSRSNFLVCLTWDDDRVGLAYVDASTGEFSVGEIPAIQVNDVLGSLGAAEVVVASSAKNLLHGVNTNGIAVSTLDDWVFGFDFAYETLLRHFETHSLKGFGIEELHVGIVAAGAALHYLSETQKGALPHLKTIKRYDTADYMVLDEQTLRNLELIGTIQSGSREGSLIDILDATLTPMGARMLRNWLIRPLRKVAPIIRRLDAVEEFVSSRRGRDRLRDELRQVGDLERVVAKVCLGRAMPRDVLNLRLGLEQIPALKGAMNESNAEATVAIREGLKLCKEVVDMVGEAISDDPPATLGQGGVIRKGHSSELDELRELASSGRKWVAKLQADEAMKTGIPSLKVGYNKVFGYYLEVTNAHKSKVPEHYIRKQTLVNAERYVTPELKEYEEKILTADEKIGQLEQELFSRLTMSIAEHALELQNNARLLAELDVYAALAEVAERDRYCRPVVDGSRILDITDGRHPVVESVLPPGEPFIPNSVRLDPAEHQILIITGPNMAGKSVVLRQTGLIALLAQIGSFVPARKARIGLVDKIFTRVGASDNLASGESTFLVEMNETANILNNASPSSLILFDEVGRGTSTFDGISIAWSIVEYLHEREDVAARTLFATHYHELNMLADRLDRVHNARILVQEHEGKVVFLRNLVSGAADHSYGIEVAKLAGLPEAVIRRAREIMTRLEDEKLSLNPDALKHAHGPDFEAEYEKSEAIEELIGELRGLDPNTMTPIEALARLAELRQKLD